MALGCSLKPQTGCSSGAEEPSESNTPDFRRLSLVARYRPCPRIRDLCPPAVLAQAPVCPHLLRGRLELRHSVRPRTQAPCDPAKATVQLARNACGPACTAARRPSAPRLLKFSQDVHLECTKALGALNPKPWIIVNPKPSCPKQLFCQASKNIQLYCISLNPKPS